MTISSATNSTASSYAKSSASSIAKSTTSSNSGTTASDISSTPSAFGEMVTQAGLSSLPSKTLSPEVNAATVPSTTIQTSGYVFDPLGVVGALPESNTFLQAIRQMMGKPLDAAVTEEATPAKAESSSTATTTTAAALTQFGNLPPATTTMLAAPVMQPTQTDLSTAQQDAPLSTQAGKSSVDDLMSSIEAQLSYQSSAPEATAAPSQATNVASIVEAATTSAQSSMTGDLVDRYLAETSAAASARAQSDLASAVDEEAQVG